MSQYLQMMEMRKKFLWKRFCSLILKKKWKARWCILVNGALLIKGKQEDQSSLKDILLKGCEVRKSEAIHKRDFVFTLVTSYEELLFSVESEKSVDDWVEKINEVKNKEINEKKKKKKTRKIDEGSKKCGRKSCNV